MDELTLAILALLQEKNSLRTNSRTDAEIAKANKTHEEGLRRKYDFKGEGTARRRTSARTADTTSPAGALTAEQIREIIREENKAIREGYDSLRAEKPQLPAANNL